MIENGLIFILYSCASMSFYAEAGSMLGSTTSNYWDSCRDHDVFGGIGYIVKHFIYSCTILDLPSNDDLLNNVEHVPSCS